MLSLKAPREKEQPATFCPYHLAKACSSLVGMRYLTAPGVPLADRASRAAAERRQSVAIGPPAICGVQYDNPYDNYMTIHMTIHMTIET